ncbi:MAG TPA: hypothetical protein VN822_06840 [Candidatus Acidoferrales bacterium]|nr:hypothetical protein [Candidatus Acidoferrales bacterium]
MNEKTNSSSTDSGKSKGEGELERLAAGAVRPNLEDPSVVLSLLETDQVVAAKRRTRFGRRDLSFGLQALLWSLRIYVVVMLVIVLISVLRAVEAAR